jgi:hypothetical protein
MRSAFRSRLTGAAGPEFEETVLPFAAIRAISDTAHQVRPPAALVPLWPDGAGDWRAVLVSVIWQPSQLPDLWAMVKGFDAAMETLRAVRERLNLADLVPQPASGACAGEEVGE